MTYSRRLEEAMKHAEVDRKALAKHLGISVQAVGAVLIGKTKAFDAANHVKVSLRLKCDPLWLATGVRQHGFRRDATDESWPFPRVPPSTYFALTPIIQQRVQDFLGGVIAASSDQGADKSARS
jgi:hypothetical protein